MKINNDCYKKTISKGARHKPSDKAILSAAILGMVACAVDGTAKEIEIVTLRQSLARLYRLHKQEIDMFMRIGAKFLTQIEILFLVNRASEVLREELSHEELLEIFNYLSDILISDGNIEDEEEAYLAEITQQFDLVDTLRSIVAANETPHNYQVVC